MNRLLATRGFMSVAVIVIAMVVVTVAYLIAFNPMKKMVAYCAIMPDAVGLYTGNNVTMLGVPVGRITKIQPENGAVRVDFDVEPAHALRGEARATTVSESLVADRTLALISDQKSESEWNPDTCITKTLTPKSISDTLLALNKLATELNGDDPSEKQSVNKALFAIDEATAGTGPKINELIMTLGRAFDSPDAAIGRIGEMIDAMSELMTSINANWGSIETMLTRLPEVLDQASNELFGPVKEIVDHLEAIVPALNDLAKWGGDYLIVGLDATVPIIRLAAANVGPLIRLVEMIPPITQAFERSVDPQTRRVVLNYAPPRAALAQPDARKVCTAMNALAPGRCKNDAAGLANVDLVPLVLGMAGAR